MGTPAVDDYTLLCEEIRALVDSETAPPKASLEHLEERLTEGYARALALDAERLRLERRIGELAGDLRRGGGEPSTEIATLGARLAQASTRLARLRALLRALRRRADRVRRDARGS